MNRHLRFLLLLIATLTLATTSGCESGNGGDLDTLDSAEDDTQDGDDADVEDDTHIDGDVEDDTSQPDTIEPAGTGCPSDTGARIVGEVRRASKLQPSPESSGSNVVVNPPCGRADNRTECAQGHLYVHVCETADCSGPNDPLRSHFNPEASLLQESFDMEAFEFCGLEDGTYYVLPHLDHDEDLTISNLDWLMGRKNITSTSVAWPAGVEGYEVTVSGADVELVTGAGPNGTPVRVDYLRYKHPTPERQTEDGWLYAVSTLHPDVSALGMGVRAIDLSTLQEKDFDASSPQVDAQPLFLPDGSMLESPNLYKLMFEDGVLYIADPDNGMIHTAALSDAGEVTQGNSVDISHLFESGHFINQATLVEREGSRFMVVTIRLSSGAPLPNSPQQTLIVVNVDGLDADHVAGQGQVFGGAADLGGAFFNSRLDAVIAHRNGLVVATESADNSKAANDVGLNRMMAFNIDASGTPINLGRVDVNPYFRGLAEECSAPYHQAGLWVGDFNGAPHAFVGGHRELAVFKFIGDDPLSGERVLRDGDDLELADYASGFATLVPNLAGDRLFAIPDCKSQAQWVIDPDGVNTTGNRQRIPVLDLTRSDRGLPAIDDSFQDAVNGPDVIRRGFSAPNEVLSEGAVMGLGMDCRAVHMDLYSTFGYTNIAGNTFQSDCAANRISDAVISDHHVYMVGAGSVNGAEPGERQTGLGTASEMWLIDLDEGRELLHPDWQWFYDGSSDQRSFGRWGFQFGDRSTNEVTRGLVIVR